MSLVEAGDATTALTQTQTVSPLAPGAESCLAGRYAILRELGRGGMGVVYLARDQKLERLVALKLLSPTLVQAPVVKERFLREARAAAALHHPNICTVYECDESDGWSFISMAYIEGEDLRTMIDREPIPWERAADIATQVAEGLEAAHEAGIVHRDIKSANIRIASTGRATIMDFGIARMGDPAALTQEGMTLGTVAYMSPEQLRGTAVDHRADIWSLGVVLYEMLTGHLPFRGESSQAMLYSILFEAPPPLNQRPGGRTPELEAVVRRALAKDAQRRYGSARDFVTDLDSLRAGTPVPARPADHEPVERSVAVFDFTNISGDPDAAWLSSGMAETISVDLKHVSSLKVVAREQVQRTLGPGADQQVTDQRVIDLGRALGARWIVWGGFQRMGDHVRITSHCTDVELGTLVGSTRVDGTMSEIFQLQDRVMAGLMASLAPEVPDHEREKIGLPETTAVEAYECYAKGRHLINQMGRSGMLRAMQLFEQAVSIDPGYALAYSGLGNLHTLRFIATSDPADLDRGISYLNEATTRDPDLADPYLWLAYGYTRKGLFQEAVRAGRRAVSLEPDHPLAHYFLGLAHHVRTTARFEPSGFAHALDHYRISAQLQPNYQPAYMNAAWIYRLRGQHAAAERLLQKAVAIEESGQAGIVTFVGSMTLTGNLRLRQNRTDEAADWYRRAVARLETTDHIYRNAFLALTSCGQARIELSRRQFDRALDLYKQASTAIGAEARALGSGYLRIAVLLGMAVTFLELGLPRESRDRYREAEDLLRTKAGYDFGWIWEGSDAQAYYEMAACRARSLQAESALDLLDRARACGWSDLAELEADPAFERLRSSSGYRTLREALAHAEPMPEHPDF